MSILSAVWHRLTKGDDPLAIFRETKTQIDSWAAGISSKVPTAAKPMMDALVAEVKQGASDLAGHAIDSLPGLLSGPTAIVDDAFAAAALAYLGPGLGRVLSNAEVDGLNRLESWFIKQIKSAKLSHIAAVTGVSVPVQPAVDISHITSIQVGGVAQPGAGHI